MMTHSHFVKLVAAAPHGLDVDDVYRTTFTIVLSVRDLLLVLDSLFGFG